MMKHLRSTSSRGTAATRRTRPSFGFQLLCKAGLLRHAVPRNDTGGYTVAEMAIVLSIVSVVVGMSVSAGVTQLEATRIGSTKSSLETVREALLVYQKKQGRYPCPADPEDIPTDLTYGIEAAGGCASGCPIGLGLTCVGDAVIGAIPFKTLKVNPETTIDGWDRKSTYAIDKDHTTASLFDDGSLKIRDASGQEITQSPVLGDAVFVLISHGEDGGGAYLADSGTQVPCVAGHIDTSNCDNADDVFIDERLNNADVAASYFDDIVVWQTQENLNVDNTTDTPEYLYVTDIGNNRVQKFDSNGVYVSQFGEGGSGIGQFNSPHGIVVDRQNNIFVADFGNDRVQKFDIEGNFILQFGSSGSTDGLFDGPDEMALDPSGNLYVVDSGNSRVQKFDSNGGFMDKFGIFGTGAVEFTTPEGIAIDSSGNIYVSDPADRIQKISSAFAQLDEGGVPGNGNGELNNPSSLVVDSNGNVWVMDHNNNRVQKFDSNLDYADQFGSSGTGNKQFNLPEGAVLDADGNLWVTDLGNHRVQKFDSNGVYLMQFGEAGTEDGQFSGPESIAIGTE